MIQITIRQVKGEDLDAVTDIESVCFPEAEAATKEAFSLRLANYPECFLVAEADGKLIGFVNGCATDSPVIVDELYHKVKDYDPAGQYLAIFGLDVLPTYRQQGIAAQLLRQYIELAKQQQKKGVILTCKDKLVHYYQSFGFVNHGVSESTHGGAEWFDMTLLL